MATENIDKPSAAWKAAAPAWKLVATLNGGTAEMREAGRVYLPQEVKESDAAYEMRLQAATLLPAYRRTVETFVGKPLEKQIQISEDTPEDIFDWLKNVDLTGRDIDIFARDVFKSAINDGLTHILVDYPTVPAAGEETLADERAANRRPYAVHILAKDLIGFKSALVNGKQQLTQIRILESIEESDPSDEFTTIIVKKVRVLEPGRARVFRQSQEGQWAIESDNHTTMAEIPLVTVYTNRKGFMLGLPPLLDLAYMNVAHWQSTSDQRTILHVARVPILHIATDAKAEDVMNITIGASRALTTDKDTTVKFIEHTGAAIAAGQADLDSLKQEMAMYAMELLVQPAAITATERIIDKSENDSSLSVMARELRAGLRKMVRYMADWAKKPEGIELGDIDLRTDFKVNINASELSTLWNMRINGDLSQESFWFEMQRRGILTDAFDPAQEAAMLADELPPIGDNGGAQGGDEPNAG